MAWRTALTSTVPACASALDHAVAQAGTVNALNAVRQAMYGQRLAAPSGFEVTMQGNHMLSKPAKVNDKGLFEVIWRSANDEIAPDAWSKYLQPRLRSRQTGLFVDLRRFEPTVKD